MTRRRLRWIKRMSAAIVAGWVFGSLSCVQNVADTAGTGLSPTEATGVLGTVGPTANATGAGLDVLAEIVRFGPKIH
jgi:hypothetical protein